MKKIFVVLFFGFLTNSVFASDFSSQLKGKRLVLDGAVCAGWQFDKSGQFADLRNEGECTVSDTYKSRWRVKWLDNDNLFFTEIERPDDTSPPRVFIYQIISIKGKTVTTKDYWTGWGKSSVDAQTFHIK